MDRPDRAVTHNLARRPCVMNEERTNTTADSHTPTTEQAAWMRDQLAEQFPDLSASASSSAAARSTSRRCRHDHSADPDHRRGRGQIRGAGGRLLAARARPPTHPLPRAQRRQKDPHPDARPCPSWCWIGQDADYVSRMPGRLSSRVPRFPGTPPRNACFPDRTIRPIGHWASKCLDPRSGHRVHTVRRSHLAREHPPVSVRGMAVSRCAAIRGSRRMRRTEPPRVLSPHPRRFCSATSPAIRPAYRIPLGMDSWRHDRGVSSRPCGVRSA